MRTHLVTWRTFVESQSCAWVDWLGSARLSSARLSLANWSLFTTERSECVICGRRSQATELDQHQIVIPCGWDGCDGASATTQYHIQTDEGPERSFRFQTANGQFRKERRLQDGTVIGTDAWIDAAGFLRLTDYIADKQGYRILKSKTVFVGVDRGIEDAIKSTKSEPAHSGVLVDGKQGLNGRPNSIASPSDSNKYNGYVLSTPGQTITSTTVAPPTEAPILGYLPPAEAAKLEPTPFLGFDHYPNEVPQPQSSTRRQPAQEDISSVSPPSLEMEPPHESRYRRIRPIAVAPVKPEPVSVEEAANGAPLAPSNRGGYHYGPSTSRTFEGTSPLDVNSLEGLLPPPPPIYRRRNHNQNRQRPSLGSNDFAVQAPNGFGDVVGVTQNGFHYYLPHQYHEEERFGEQKQAGSFGYVDPFGIRRVVYYNASPGRGFVHRNHNRYVGLDAAPFDEPPPTAA